MKDAIDITVPRPPAPTDAGLLAVRFTLMLRTDTLPQGEPYKTLDEWRRRWTELSSGFGPVPFLHAMKVIVPMAGLRLYGAAFTPTAQAWLDEVDAAFERVRRDTDQSDDDPPV